MSDGAMQRSERTIRRTPVSVDNSVPILFWDPVDFIGAMSIFGMFIAFNMFFLGAVLAVFVLMIASRLRQGAKRGAAQHWLWHMGVSVDRALDRAKLKSWHNDFLN